MILARSGRTFVRSRAGSAPGAPPSRSLGFKNPAVYFTEPPDEENPSLTWGPGTDRRTGALALKLGMVPLWDPWGIRTACTVLYVDNNRVVQVRTAGGDGYDAVQVGAGARKRTNATGAGHVRRWAGDAAPPDILREFRLCPRRGQRSPAEAPPVPPPGTRIHARHFVPGQLLDVAGTSKGKGFQGGMKRHGFKGMPASHGTSLSHRAIGSTGACQDPGKVWKGKKMPGRMGSDRVTVHNLRLYKVDAGRDLLYVAGHVPGQNGGWIEVRDALRENTFGTRDVLGGVDRPPVPTFVPGLYDAGGLYDGDDYVDGTGATGYEFDMPYKEVDPLAPEVTN